MIDQDIKDIAALSTFSDVDRVIDEENTKVFEKITTVLYLDDKVPGDNYKGSTVSFENPVPVYDSERNNIGAATLTVDGTRVEAQLFIKYDSPERLTIETKSSPLFAHIAAMEAMDNTSTNVGETAVWRVSHTYITEIELLDVVPRDSRLEQL